MPGAESQRGPEFGEGVWALNRWPTVGLCTGAGIGLIIGIAFLAPWLLTVGLVAAGAIVGCLLGFALATLVYGGVDDPAQDDDLP